MTHTDTTIAGIEPGTELTVSDEKRERGLKYVSKSRIESWHQCPFKFALKYWMEHRPPGTFYTERGSEVHLIYEKFHNNLVDYIDKQGERPERFTKLMPQDGNETQWIEFIGSFLKFEERRWKESQRSIDFAASRIPSSGLDTYRETLNAWKPVEIEAEFWLGKPPDDYKYADPDHIDSSGPPVGDIPWMGKADVILNSASVPGVTGSGVTIIDYKTGSCPTVKYEGAPFLDDILNKKFRETEYYGWLAEDVYDVDAVGIYFPKNDELLIGEYGVKDRRFEIKQAALGMQEVPKELNNDGEPINFNRDQGNLCHWGDGCCYFYNICESDEGMQT